MFLYYKYPKGYRLHYNFMIQQVVDTYSNTNKLFIYIYIHWQIKQQNTYMKKKKVNIERKFKVKFFISFWILWYGIFYILLLKWSTIYYWIFNDIIIIKSLFFNIIFSIHYWSKFNIILKSRFVSFYDLLYNIIWHLILTVLQFQKYIIYII